MTAPISTPDPCIVEMRAAAAASMLDGCKLGTVTVDTTSTYADETVTWGNPIACGFRATTSSETRNGSQSSTGEAELRLPFGTSVTGYDRVQITSRGGTTLSEPAAFRVVGAPRIGITVTLLRLQALSAGGVG